MEHVSFCTKVANIKQEGHLALIHSPESIASRPFKFSLYLYKVTNVPSGWAKLTQGYNLNNFCRSPLDNASCQISKL